MNKPEALRLADVSRLSRYHEWHLQVDAELRRLHAANEQLAAEVANRNRRALDGDEAVFALANVHAYYEKLEAQRDALLEALRLITDCAGDIATAPDSMLEMALTDGDEETRRQANAFLVARSAIKAVEETK